MEFLSQMETEVRWQKWEAGHFRLELEPMEQLLPSKPASSPTFLVATAVIPWHVITDNLLGSTHFPLCTHNTQIGGNFAPENQLAQTQAG